MILEYAANGNLRDYLLQRRLASSLTLIKESNNHCDSGLEEGSYKQIMLDINRLTSTKLNILTDKLNTKLILFTQVIIQTRQQVRSLPMRWFHLPIK